MPHTEITEVLAVEPTNTPVGAGDTYIQMEKAGTTNVHTNLTVWFGKFIDGKFQQEFIGFWRYEIDMAQGRKISEAALTFAPFANGLSIDAVTPNKIKGGFLKPQVSSPAWEDANGVAEWATDLDMPLPMWNDGANVDNTVFEGNNFAFALPDTDGSSNPAAVVAFGEGATLLALATHPNDTEGLAGIGMVQQLQDYVDNNEALRGHTVTGKIPVLFCLYLDGARAQDGAQDMAAQNFGTGALLRVIHDWERIDAAAELQSATDVDFGPGTIHDVKFGNVELLHATLLDAAALAIARGATELKSSTALDALPVVFSIGPIELVAIPDPSIPVILETNPCAVLLAATSQTVSVPAANIVVEVAEALLPVLNAPTIIIAGKED